MGPCPRPGRAAVRAAEPARSRSRLHAGRAFGMAGGGTAPARTLQCAAPVEMSATTRTGEVAPQIRDCAGKTEVVWRFREAVVDLDPGAAVPDAAAVDPLCRWPRATRPKQLRTSGDARHDAIAATHVEIRLVRPSWRGGGCVAPGPREAFGQHGPSGDPDRRSDDGGRSHPISVLDGATT